MWNVHTLELRTSFTFGLLWQRSKCAKNWSYFGHACLKLILVFVSLLTGKCDTQKKT